MRISRSWTLIRMTRWQRRDPSSLAMGGTPMGPYDVLIAGQAKAPNLVLVTNIKEFTRVDGLIIED